MVKASEFIAQGSRLRVEGFKAAGSQGLRLLVQGFRFRA